MIFCTGLLAQYDEKQILLKNAADMIKVRKYTLAEDLYQEAIDKYPDDSAVITGLLNLYVRTNNGSEGLKIVKEKAKFLEDSVEINYEITFMLIDKNNDKALSKAKDFLRTNDSPADFKNLGNLFQKYRAYNQSTDILLEGEKKYPNDFSFELADSYYFSRDYDRALNYYLIALENNIGSKNLINSRIRNIINQAPKSITGLIDYFGTDSINIQITKDNKSVINVYVDALLNTGRTNLALDILNKFEAKDIYTKAEQFKRLKEYDISRTLYELTLEKVDDLSFYYRYALNFAKMLSEASAFTDADSLINIITDEQVDQRYNRNLLFESYILKADIANRNKEMSLQYESLLKEAEKFAYNNNQKQTLKSKLSYYKLLNQEYPEAKRYLDQLARYGKNESYFFNYYLYEILQGGGIADSLATELILLGPESDNTIEMLSLKHSLKALNQTDRKLFLDAYRKEKLFLTEEADSLYSQLYDTTKNEYYIIKNALMNIKSNNFQRAQQLLSNNFTDDFSRDFAAMQLVFLEDKNSQLARDMARNFLTQYPNSSFAAQVRQILMINNNN